MCVCVCVCVCVLKLITSPRKPRPRTSGLVHEGDEASHAQREAEDGAGRDRDVGDEGEPCERALVEGGIDEVGVVVADKGWGRRREGGGEGGRER